MSILDSIYIQVARVNAANSPYSVKSSDYRIIVDATDGPVIIRLPPTYNLNLAQLLAFQKIDFSLNAVRIMCVDGLIDDANEYQLVVQYQSVELIYSNPGWNTTTASGREVQAAGQTIGNTIYEGGGITIPPSSARGVQVSFRGQTVDASECCSQIMAGLFRNTAGVVSRVGNLVDIQPFRRTNGLNGAGCDIVIVGTKVTPHVQGKSGVTVNWLVHSEFF